MKSLYLTLFTVLSLPLSADIGLGTGSRTAPTSTEPSAQHDFSADKAALLEAIKLMSDEKGAAAAEKQMTQQAAAMRDMVKKYDDTVRQIDALAPQVETQMQKAVSGVADMAQGKGLTNERDKKLHALLMKNIPEEGYDASGAHDIDAAPAPPKKPERTAPPLRPLPQEPAEPLYDTSSVHDMDAIPVKRPERKAPPLRPLPKELQ